MSPFALALVLRRHEDARASSQVPRQVSEGGGGGRSCHTAAETGLGELAAEGKDRGRFLSQDVTLQERGTNSTLWQRVSTSVSGCPRRLPWESSDHTLWAQYQPLGQGHGYQPGSAGQRQAVPPRRLTFDKSDG